MSLTIGTLAVALLVGIGLLAIGLKAHKQNVPLMRALRNGNIDVKSILWRSLIVWSPMLLVMAILLSVASAMSQGATELVYRYSTLDEFCEVQGIDKHEFIACTGMAGELVADDIKQLDPRDDIERQLFRRYRETRKRVLQTPVDKLRLQARNAWEFKKIFSPAGVLGLPPVTEDDVVLSQLITERRRLLESPVSNPTDIAELMSYRQSVATRARFLRELDLKIEARRKALFVAEYGGLTPEKAAQLQHKNRILQLLRQVDAGIDPAVVAAFFASDNTTPVTTSDFVKSGLVRSLADSERNVREVLAREIDSPDKAAVSYDALNMAAECTVATKNTAVRINSENFNAKLPDPASFTTNNSGSFPCFSRSDAAVGVKLVSVGFRKSVLLSIDRWRDDAAFSAFKKLASLERHAENAGADAKMITQEVANVVPAVIPLGRQDCSVFHPVNCLINGLLDSAETIYVRSRNELVRIYPVKTDSYIDESEMTIRQSIDHARMTTDDEVNQMHAAGYKAAESLFRLSDWLRLIGWIALVLIALRSFLYVLALELFDRNADLKISFHTENVLQGQYKIGPEITINRDFPFAIINRGSLTNTLADIKFAPWKWSAPFKRILLGRYFFFNWSVFSPPTQATDGEDVTGMEASARSGYSIVEWRMQPGEEVIFNYRDFYGASANVQLKTDISFRLSTLLLGRIFFHYARCEGGEGRLLLEARVHNTPKDSISSFKPARLVAWNRHAKFSADSHHNPWKTMLNPYTIVRESGPGIAKGLFIIAPESESAQIFGAGMRSLRQIFSRIF